MLAAALPAPSWANRMASARWSGLCPCSSSRAQATDAAALQNNLAIARYPLQGPARSLADFEKGIAFCEQRGLASQAKLMEADCPGLLVELGRPDEALERAGAVAAADEARGGTMILIWVRALELATHVARGESDGAAGIADWLVEAARTQATPDTVAEALPAAASARLVTGTPGQARALLAEIEQTPGARDTPYYSRQLAGMLRTALAAGDPDLARRLADGHRTPLPAPRARPLRRRARNSPSTPAITPMPQPCTAKRPHAGSSSGTSASTPTPSSARAAAWSHSETPPPSNRSARRPSCSLDGLPPRARRDRSTPRASSRAYALDAPS